MMIRFFAAEPLFADKKNNANELFSAHSRVKKARIGKSEGAGAF
jgi:hypothetical protein